MTLAFYKVLLHILLLKANGCVYVVVSLHSGSRWCVPESSTTRWCVPESAEPRQRLIPGVLFTLCRRSSCQPPRIRPRVFKNEPQRLTFVGITSVCFAHYCSLKLNIALSTNAALLTTDNAFYDRPFFFINYCLTSIYWLQKNASMQLQIFVLLWMYY